MMQIVEHDRGLGTAYERVQFYELVDRWATEYGIESAAEGPYDGMAGVSGVHLAGLARRGIPVVSVVRSNEHAGIARSVYRTAGTKHVELLVAGCGDAVSLMPSSDMVLAYHAFEMVDDWRRLLQDLAGKARKILVVTTCNPSNWGVSLLRILGRVRGVAGLNPPDAWRADVLAPVLWELGRVREQAYFDCPWWPDLQVSPGQSLVDRGQKLLLGRRERLAFTASGSDSQLSARHVYGAECWPYFRGSAGSDELATALRRHPTFDSAALPIRRVMAHLHAFVVDVRKRRPGTVQGAR